MTRKRDPKDELEPTSGNETVLAALQEDYKSSGERIRQLAHTVYHALIIYCGVLLGALGRFLPAVLAGSGPTTCTRISISQLS